MTDDVFLKLRRRWLFKVKFHYAAARPRPIFLYQPLSPFWCVEQIDALLAKHVFLDTALHVFYQFFVLQFW